MREKKGTGNAERGTGKAKLWLALAAIAGAAMVLVMARGVVSNAPQPQSGETALNDGCGGLGTSRPAVERNAAVGRDVLDGPQSQEDEASSDEDSADNEAPLTETEKREAEEEKLVNAFDDLTDKWMEPSAKGVAMSDVDSFAKHFRRVPKARQDECIHRALNLIPDENVILLAGILMDKSMDKEIIETIYNDILNRDETVKKPILQQIFKDKTHPCWADTAWILDVTGELPKAK